MLINGLLWGRLTTISFVVGDRKKPWARSIFMIRLNRASSLPDRMPFSLPLPNLINSTCCYRVSVRRSSLGVETFDFRVGVVWTWVIRRLSITKVVHHLFVQGAIGVVDASPNILNGSDPIGPSSDLVDGVENLLLGLYGQWSLYQLIQAILCGRCSSLSQNLLNDSLIILRAILLSNSCGIRTLLDQCIDLLIQIDRRPLGVWLCRLHHSLRLLAIIRCEICLICRIHTLSRL
jgi:hypothetical protein